MSGNLVVIGTEKEITVVKKCPFCSLEVPAYPKRVTNQVGWSDYSGIRTNRVSIEFESTHQCGPVVNPPVEKVEHTPYTQDILDCLTKASTPPKGWDDGVQYTEEEVRVRYKNLTLDPDIGYA